jgi:hypothetical protein
VLLDALGAAAGATAGEEEEEEEEAGAPAPFPADASFAAAAAAVAGTAGAPSFFALGTDMTAGLPPMHATPFRMMYLRQQRKNKTGRTT